MKLVESLKQNETLNRHDFLPAHPFTHNYPHSVLDLPTHTHIAVITQEGGMQEAGSPG